MPSMFLSKLCQSSIEFPCWFYYGFHTHIETKINKLFGYLIEIVDAFMINQDNHNTQVENKTNITSENGTSGNSQHLDPVNGSQVDIQAIERIIKSKVRCEVGNAVATVETRVHDAILVEMDSLVKWK